MRPEVKHTTDFDRIVNLPRRVLRQVDADAWAAALTPELALTARAQLRPWQALSIAEVVENRGGWLALPVGLGKTLVSYAVPRLLGAKRPVIIVPASLRDKTRHDFASYVGVWRAPNPPPLVLSLQELAPEGGRDRLDAIDPDCLIIDESHKLANRDSSAARRIDRLVVRKQDDLAVVAMTGTPSRNSIMGYWHVLAWCLRERSPLPLTEGEALMWDGAISEKPEGSRGKGGPRPHPGPLGPNIRAAREWYRKRLAETPGVVIVDGDSCTQPLEIRVRPAKECRDIDEIYKRFGTAPETFDVPVSDPLSRWRIDGQLGCGYYQYYDPPPPEVWRVTRRAVAAFVQSAIEQSTYTGKPLDSEGQVLRRFRDHELVQEWRRIKPTYDARKHLKVRWVSSATLESAVEWLAESDEPGIVWCGNVPFAGALSHVARLSYYGAEGKDQNGRGLHIAPPNRSLVASWNANMIGFNLQAWRRHLIVHPPQSALYLEQIFGRSHRSGQERPVCVDVLATSGGTLDAFDSATGEAGFAKSTVSLTQKILRAKIKIQEPRITARNRYRWARKEHE
jgi:hypothetical protein